MLLGLEAMVMGTVVTLSTVNEKVLASQYNHGDNSGSAWRAAFSADQRHPPVVRRLIFAGVVFVQEMEGANIL